MSPNAVDFTRTKALKMTEREILAKARAYALSIVEKVDHYTYHNVGHTIEVYARASYLADVEGISEEEKTDLLIAAAFHDTGFATKYPQNEIVGADLAEEFLRSVGHPDERISRVRRIILATIVFTRPADILEKIIQDADLDNLGRRDCHLRTDAYRRELQTYSPNGFDENGFLNFTEKLLDGGFTFHTETARREREEGRIRNLEAFRARYR